VFDLEGAWVVILGFGRGRGGGGICSEEWVGFEGSVGVDILCVCWGIVIGFEGGDGTWCERDLGSGRRGEESVGTRTRLR
jgi:hypothetical protein